MIKQQEFSITGANQKTIAADLTYDANNTNAPLVIFVHGFKGFKDWGAHHLVARYFAQNGYRFLKFNFSHSGVTPDQPNEVSDMETFASNTVSKEMLDLDLVINYALQYLKVSEVALIGHSRGGGISILQAANQPKITRLITWSAIADFSSLWKNESEEAWKKTGRIFVTNARTNEKMPMNVDLLTDFEEHKATLTILTGAKQIHIPWLIVQGDADVNVPFETAKELANANLNSRLAKIENANHVYGASHPYVNENLPLHLLNVCEKSLQFLQLNDAGL